MRFLLCAAPPSDSQGRPYASSESGISFGSLPAGYGQAYKRPGGVGVAKPVSGLTGVGTTELSDEASYQMSPRSPESIGTQRSIPHTQSLLPFSLSVCGAMHLLKFVCLLPHQKAVRVEAGLRKNSLQKKGSKVPKMV